MYIIIIIIIIIILINSWSFGVVMWEVVTVGGTPYSDVNLDDIYPQLMSGLRLQRPNHCTQPIYDIMTSCWENIPQHRPTFLEITDQLQSLNTTKMVCGVS